MKTLITTATLLAVALSTGSAMASGGAERTTARIEKRLAQIEQKRKAQEEVAQQKELAEKAKRS
ncbi:MULTISPECIES: hypothetical protein [unclassified Pseudomonas]|uniref:hypothetical protein n=1 Tax=unclassified Pseudomonas TaxID=196821 RepID=UPI0024579CFE|nr:MULTISPECIES: hypothetical protein [unclassified Pseudomonas]MDH4561728.1 hypothetical protein [Pseudomonas sp. BN411]MDH4869769.1 hypothetical protein [Pseudomonas sp. BN515]